MLEHRFGGKVVLRGVGHETFKGVASWFYIGDVTWDDTCKTQMNAHIEPNNLCGEHGEVVAASRLLNRYLSEQGQWLANQKILRDGRIVFWVAKQLAGEQLFEENI